MEAFGEDSSVDLSTKFVVDGDAMYMQMTAWPPPMQGRWLRYTAEDFAEHGVDGVTLGEVLPRLLVMLESAQAAPTDKNTGDTVFVNVPAADAMSAFPSSSAAKLMQRGLDLGDLKGHQLVRVYIDDSGRIGEVRLDADKLFDQAYALAGLPKETAGAITAVTAHLSLSDYGNPVTVVVPTGRAVATSAEFEGMQG